MKLSDWSDKASGKYSWSSTLYTILRPAPRPLSAKFGNSCSRYRHSPGNIWRHMLAVSVYHDLAGSALTHHSRQSITWRRFVRVEHLGLSGVVLYEIPIPPSFCSGSVGEGASIPKKKAEPLNTARGTLAMRIRRTSPVVAPPRITLTSVFGDLDNDEDAGMDLDDLMDEIDAKVVYFPAYACTSFIVGQVMSAFLNDCPSRKPVPAHEGFSVCLGDTATEPPAPNASLDNEALSLVGATPTSSSIRKVDDLLCFPAHSIPDMLTLEADDPYTTLCVRSSAAYLLPAGSSFLGLFCQLRKDDNESLNSLALSQNADDEAEIAPIHRASSPDDPDSDSNIATDGQSSPAPKSAIAPTNGPAHSSTPRSKDDHPYLPRRSAMTASTRTDFLAEVREDYPSNSETRHKLMNYLLSFDSFATSIARRAMNQKYYRLRSSHSLSTMIPCLAGAKKHPQSLYVYKDFLASESFMDFSGTN